MECYEKRCEIYKLRLTCKWTHPEETDPRFDYDALHEENEYDQQNEYNTCDSNPFELLRKDLQKDFDEVAVDFESKFRREEDKLLHDFSSEDQIEIREYANIHYITIADAIEYQTHCHNCGKDTPNSLISSGSHQYCSYQCQEYCETYCYACVYSSECLVCANWTDESETVFI